MRVRSFSAGFLVVASIAELASAANVTVDPTQNQLAISPYVYGANQVNGTTVVVTARRWGGNRLTGYNWENNYSNAGTDWEQSSDTYLCDDATRCSQPGAAATIFVDGAKVAKAYSLVTLQMAGYVAADDNGTVATSEVAPSARWKKVVASKGSALVTTPVLTDDNVYMDEFVNFLVQRYGAANAGGVEGYSLDNEPDLWSSTHPLIHPAAVGAAELVTRSVELAKAVKAVDPSAEIFGFVSYGYNGFINLQDAPDWDSVKGSHDWYVAYYLAQMAAASASAGKRLLDVIDLHFYSEATQGGSRVQEGTTGNQGARVQSTRSLWDASYGYSATNPTVGENSWITEWAEPIELIPRVKRTIAAQYPGTKLAITEYDFGAANHVSGGIAQADALGIFGKHGVHFASRWGTPGSYTDAAYRLYLDYDGKGSRFGSVSVQAETSDVINVPAYAALDQTDPTKLHVILINRNLNQVQATAVTIGGSSSYLSGNAWGFDGTTAALTALGAITVTNNAFSVSLPALSARHVVLTTDQPPVITNVGGASGTGGTVGTAAGGSTGVAAGGTVAGTVGGTGAVAVGGAGGGAVAVAGTAAADNQSDKERSDAGCGCRLAGCPGTSKALLAVFAAILVMRRKSSSRHLGRCAPV